MYHIKYESWDQLMATILIDEVLANYYLKG